MDEVISVESLNKRFGDLVAVDDISFSVRRGEVFGILGPNGAGKTTTLECIEGLQEPSSGRISVLGTEIARDPNTVKERIGVQLQASAYFDYLTLTEILELFGRFYSRRVPPAELLSTVGLEDKANTTVGKLSGGQQQRFTIAATLVNDPEVVFLDEPTAGLDPNQVRSVRRLIRELAGGHTVLISSHILSEIEMTCDRVVILHEGRLLASGALEELMAKANAAVVAEVRASLTDAKKWAAKLALGQAECAARQDGYVRCQFADAKSADAREKIFASANERGWPLRELSRQAPSLEDLFVNLTHGKGGGK